MNKLTNEELNNIEGGVLKKMGVWAMLAAATTIAIGFLNGILRPYSCSSGK